MPVKVTTPASSKSTSKKSTATKTRSAKDSDTPIRISEMEGGDGFHFTSKKKSANTGFYLKIKSKENKGLNLQTFKVFDFGRTDVGVPRALAIGRAA